jgi:hypothetical protein
MGLYDEIWWEAELPAGHPPDNRLFQTKSLDPCLDRYVVTLEGRLRLVGNGFQDDAAFAGARPGQEAIDVDFHGDLRLVSSVPDYEVYSARFTHGTVEWIRPSADGPSSPLAAAKQKFLSERDT